MSKVPIRIILVDNHNLVRGAWKILLENNPRFKIIADFDNGLSAIEHAQKLIPDIMLVDINMSPLNGFLVTQEIVKTVPSVKVIGISVSNQYQYATRMLEMGAKGYLTKTSSLEEITHGILEVEKGGTYICGEVLSTMAPGKKGRE